MPFDDRKSVRQAGDNTNTDAETRLDYAVIVPIGRNNPSENRDTRTIVEPADVHIGQGAPNEART